MSDRRLEEPAPVLDETDNETDDLIPQCTMFDAQWSEWLSRVWQEDNQESPDLPTLEHFNADAGAVGFPPAGHTFWCRVDLPEIVGKAVALLDAERYALRRALVATQKEKSCLIDEIKRLHELLRKAWTVPAPLLTSTSRDGQGSVHPGGEESEENASPRLTAALIESVEVWETAVGLPMEAVFSEEVISAMEAASGGRPQGVSIGSSAPDQSVQVRELSRLHASAVALQTALRAERVHSAANERRLQGSVDALMAERLKWRAHRHAAEQGMEAVAAFSAIEHQMAQLREASILARESLAAALTQTTGGGRAEGPEPEHSSATGVSSKGKAAAPEGAAAGGSALSPEAVAAATEALSALTAALSQPVVVLRVVPPLSGGPDLPSPAPASLISPTAAAAPSERGGSSASAAATRGPEASRQPTQSGDGSPPAGRLRSPAESGQMVPTNGGAPSTNQAAATSGDALSRQHSAAPASGQGSLDGGSSLLAEGSPDEVGAEAAAAAATGLMPSADDKGQLDPSPDLPSGEERSLQMQLADGASMGASAIAYAGSFLWGEAEPERHGAEMSCGTSTVIINEVLATLHRATEDFRAELESVTNPLSAAIPPFSLAYENMALTLAYAAPGHAIAPAAEQAVAAALTAAPAASPAPSPASSPARPPDGLPVTAAAYSPVELVSPKSPASFTRAAEPGPSGTVPRCGEETPSSTPTAPEATASADGPAPSPAMLTPAESDARTPETASQTPHAGSAPGGSGGGGSREAGTGAEASSSGPAPRDSVRRPLDLKGASADSAAADAAEIAQVMADPDAPQTPVAADEPQAPTTPQAASISEAPPGPPGTPGEALATAFAESAAAFSESVSAAMSAAIPSDFSSSVSAAMSAAMPAGMSESAATLSESVSAAVTAASPAVESLIESLSFPQMSRASLESGAPSTTPSIEGPSGVAAAAASAAAAAADALERITADTVMSGQTLLDMLPSPLRQQQHPQPATPGTEVGASKDDGFDGETESAAPTPEGSLAAPVTPVTPAASVAKTMSTVASAMLSRSINSLSASLRLTDGAKTAPPGPLADTEGGLLRPGSPAGDPTKRLPWGEDDGLPGKAGSNHSGPRWPGEPLKQDPPSDEGEDEEPRETPRLQGRGGDDDAGGALSSPRLVTVFLALRGGGGAGGAADDGDKGSVRCLLEVN